MGLFDKFKKGLGKSSEGLSTGFKNIFSKKKIDANLNIFMKGPVSGIKHTKLEI